jgi:hypothetical protein
VVVLHVPHPVGKQVSWDGVDLEMDLVEESKGVLHDLSWIKWEKVWHL